MKLNFNGLVREARTRAANRGLNLRFEDDNNPRTNGKTMYMQKPNPMWSDEQWMYWWGIYEHELGHNDPDMMDAFTLAKDKNLNLDSFLGSMLNLMEDHRQEHHRYDEYLGRKQRLSYYHQAAVQRVIDTNNYGQTVGNQYQDAAEVLEVWDTLEREEWMTNMAGMGDQLAASLRPDQLELLEKLVEGDYGSTLKSGITAEEEYKLLQRIFEEVFEFDFEEEEQNAQQRPSDSGDQGEMGDDDSGSEEGDSGDGEGDAGGDGEEGDEDGDKRAKGYKVKYSDILKHDHKKADDRNEGGHHRIKIEYDAEIDHFDPASPDEHIVLDYAGGKVGVNHPNHRNHGTAMNRIISDTTLHKRIRRLLQTKVAIRYQHALKRGKLSSKSIYRAGVKDSGEYQRKVFKKKDKHDELDVVFQIIMDCSGSMGKHKYDHAGASVVMFNEALAALNIPVEIIGFDERGWSPRQAIWKSFNKPVNNQELIARIADSGSRLKGQNSDGESLLWCFDRIAKQKARRKIMLVLSDGSPYSDRVGDADWYTRKVVEEIEKSCVEIYSIGIMDENVRRIYKKWRVINNADHLEDAVLDVIKEKVINV